MKLSVSAYRAHANAHKKILSSGYHTQLNYGSTGAAAGSSTSTASGLYAMDHPEQMPTQFARKVSTSDTDVISPTGTSSSGQEPPVGAMSKKRSHGHKHKDNGAHSSDSKSPSQRKSRIGDGASDPDSDWTRSNQRWMKLRTTVQISSAMQKKPPLKREDSFLKRFSTRQIPETQETVEDTGSESASGDAEKTTKRRRRYLQKRRSVVNPDENFYFYWLMILCISVLYNLWALIVRESFPELQKAVPTFWFICDTFTDVVFIFDIIVQLRTGYLEQGLMVYDDKKLACHYIHSRDFFFDTAALIPLDLLQLKMGTHPLLRFPRFLKVYRSVKFYYIVESRTVWPNLWRVVNLIHILLILAHWFGCFYYLLSEAEGFQGDWVYPYRPGDYATLTRKYLGSLYWSTLTLTTIGDLPTPETNAEPNFSVDGPRSIQRRGIKSRLLQFGSSYGYVFTIVSYLIGVFIFATIVGQVGNVITNRNANRLEFERLLDGAKTYMRHHKVPGGMKRRVLRWYDYSWSRGRIQGGGDINTALGLLPDKLKTELALHVNLSVLKKVTIFQECQPEFLHDLVLKMKAYIFTPGDSICRKGEVAREMFIIADGILEVLSETGKVLTTMKAGDFFGEIGILNLDGLNKRTADVRSVGYSELFSLSREDVLAAMKDYPDAQEILQTLGRKRLMEVRCVNKKYAKAQIEKEAAMAFQAHHHHHHHAMHMQHPSDSSENSASKKIVDKLRNDVMGFRNALKKSRPSRKSDELLEMQPLHNTSPKSAKLMLKRMSRVRSDEKDETTEEKEELHDKTPSPIGAGLPLLQRLRLLKEKQDREERAVKSTTPQPPMKSPPHSHVTCTLSPQESIKEEPEREVNEGLPLIQRLQHLKIKNDALLSENKAMLNAPATISSHMEMTTTAFMHNNGNGSGGTSSSNNGNNKPCHKSHPQDSGSVSTIVTQINPMVKVSFRQRIQQLQSGATLGDAATSTGMCDVTSGGNAPTSSIRKLEPPKTLPVVTRKVAALPEGVMPQKPIPTISNNIVKPSITTSQLTSDTDSETPIRAWSKLKLATIISSSYTSLTNCSPDSMETPLRNYSMGNLPHMIAEEGVAETAMVRRSKSYLQRGSVRARTKGGSDKLRPKPVDAVTKHAKFYQSVFDLSPEYNGLPFVKRLKILNERQKLAELENAIQTRSFSLDSSKTHNGVPLPDSLYRCYSDTSGIYSQLKSTYESSSTATSTSTSTSENLKRHAQFGVEYVLPDYTPLSPESNETLERRRLKSILKNLNKDHDPTTPTNATPMDELMAVTLASKCPPTRKHIHGLLREPTLEGPPDCAKATAFHYDNNMPEASGFSSASTSPNIAQTPVNVVPANTPETPLIASSATGIETITTAAIAAEAAAIEATATATTTKLECSKSKESNYNLISSKHSASYTYRQPPSPPTHTTTTTTTSIIDSTNICSNERNNVPKIEEGLQEVHEYFNDILCAINNVISAQISEMHNKLESQFSNMACEVKRRDAVIAQLQTKLKSLEVKTTTPSRRKVPREKHLQQQLSDDVEPKSEENSSSSGSSAELLFMRGDSLDTVFTSSPPIHGDRAFSSSSKHMQDGAYTYPKCSVPHNNGRSGGGGTRGVMLTDVTGNFTRMADSVILDIGESSSSSSSSVKLNVSNSAHAIDDDARIEEGDEAQAPAGHVRHNDWEVRMLAAEMEKQERKRCQSLSVNFEDLKPYNEGSIFLRRRRKYSESETEYSETDPDETTAGTVLSGVTGPGAAAASGFAATRPRASSLDQFNLRYGIGGSSGGIFKAMSIDRDKDKL